MWNNAMITYQASWGSLQSTPWSWIICVTRIKIKSRLLCSCFCCDDHSLQDLSTIASLATHWVLTKTKACCDTYVGGWFRQPLCKKILAMTETWQTGLDTPDSGKDNRDKGWNLDVAAQEYSRVCLSQYCFTLCTYCWKLTHLGCANTAKKSPSSLQQRHIFIEVQAQRSLHYACIWELDHREQPESIGLTVSAAVLLKGWGKRWGFGWRPLAHNWVSAIS